MARYGNPLRPRLRAYPSEVLAMTHSKHGPKCECPICETGATWRYGRRRLRGGHFKVLDVLVRYANRFREKVAGTAYVVSEVFADIIAAASGYKRSTVYQYLRDWSQVMINGEPAITRRRRMWRGDGGAAGNRNPFRALINPALVAFSVRRDPEAPPAPPKAPAPKPARQAAKDSVPWPQRPRRRWRDGAQLDERLAELTRKLFPSEA